MMPDLTPDHALAVQLAALRAERDGNSEGALMLREVAEAIRSLIAEGEA